MALSYIQAEFPAQTLDLYAGPSNHLMKARFSLLLLWPVSMKSKWNIFEQDIDGPISSLYLKAISFRWSLTVSQLILTSSSTSLNSDYELQGKRSYRQFTEHGLGPESISYPGNTERRLFGPRNRQSDGPGFS